MGIYLYTNLYMYVVTGDVKWGHKFDNKGEWGRKYRREFGRRKEKEKMLQLKHNQKRK